jgi:hypothetical protein
MIVAGGMTTMIGLGALVCDVGLAMAQRTQMQMAADAAALAAVKQMKKSHSYAQLEGITVAKLNGYDIHDTDISIDDQQEEVSVHWKQQTGFILGPVLHRMGVKIGVESVAKLVSIQTKVRIVPFLVPECDISLGAITSLKYGTNVSKNGNFGAAALDGKGAKIYEGTIINGSKTALQTGMFVDTEPGNMVGPTDSGVATLIGDDQTPYELALTTPNPRLVVVPVVDEEDFLALNGRSKPIMIRGFARFYLMGAKGGAVTGRFIDKNMGQNAPPPNETRAKLVR